jgi:YidC/Oxa1 family membrane protein insertase
MDRRLIIFVIALTLSMYAVQLFFESPYKKEQKVAVQPAAPLPEKEISLVPASKQKYYVLENEYLQLVLTNKGGAVTEINLPFQSSSNPNSAVLPIEFDREIEAKSPQNALFPLHEAEDASGNPVEQKKDGYYPLLRRGIVGAHPFQVPAKFYACNIVSEYPEMAEQIYEIISFTPSEIILQAKQANRRITKKYTLPKPTEDTPYCFTLTIQIEGASRGLWLTGGIPEIEWQSGSIGSTIKYRIQKGSSFIVEKVDLPKQLFSMSSIAPDWVCNSNGFFAIILDAVVGKEQGFKALPVEGPEDPSRFTLIDSQYERFPSKDMPGYELLIPIKPEGSEMQVRIFAGPLAESVLKRTDAFFATSGKTSDYLSSQTFHGWFAFISEPFAKFLFFLMKLCYAVTNSWALSIVFVTFILRLILYPLNNWSLRSMKAMQEVGPEVKAIQDRYKKEPQKAQLEIMALYRKKGVNPISGCLPMLLQLPFLIGMFDLLKSSFELRGAVFIPGWIDNLSSPDVLFKWTVPLPLIGNEFHLLPILLGAIMYIQQNMMGSMPKDPKLWTEQQRQQRAMGNIMTVVMTVLFYNFPSGLNIYWISSMLFGMLQQWWVNRASLNKPAKVSVEIEVQPTVKRKK